jgi:hypothetical protein
LLIKGRYTGRKSLFEAEKLYDFSGADGVGQSAIKLILSRFIVQPLMALFYKPKSLFVCAAVIQNLSHSILSLPLFLFISLSKRQLSRRKKKEANSSFANLESPAEGRLCVRRIRAPLCVCTNNKAAGDTLA